MLPLYIDIESIPAQNPAVLDEIRASFEEKAKPLREEIERLDAEYEEPTPPANYKDQEKIRAWKDEKRGKIREERDKKREKLDGIADQADQEWRKTALSGDRGEIVVIGWAFDDKPAQVAYRGLAETEPPVLEEFFDALYLELNKPGRPTTPQWVGHNVKEFDLRFIFQRAVINGRRPTAYLPHDARPGSDLIFDTMTAWAGFGNRISQDRLCRALGIPGKDGMDGSMVWDAIRDGREDAVAEYCRADVERVREIHKRMTFHQPTKSEEAA